MMILTNQSSTLLHYQSDYNTSPIMQNIQQYDPLRWPPDLQLAKIHMRCVCPGKDNIEGIQCPCCGRFEKIKTRNWYSRSILKDFKSYGGGVPGYFELLKYCWLTILILAIIVILFHIYIIETTCPLIKERYANQPLQVQLQYECQSFLVVFRICQTKVIIQTLQYYGQNAKAFAFFSLQLISFIYLIVVTIGMKLWLQRINSKKIIKQDKVYSYFALMIKNIPTYYSIDNVRKELQELVPNIDICQLFFVYQIAELENIYKQLFDLHFEIEYIKDSIASDRGQTMQDLNSSIKKYKQLFAQSDQLKKNIGVNNGRAIVVFNTTQQRNQVRKALKVNQCTKLWFHITQVFGYNPLRMHLIADKISEPQQIIWKYIGQSSITKTVVRIKTTAIGFGFMIIAFLLLYFPIIKIDEENIKNHSVVTSVLSLLISILLQVLSIVYRQILMRIVPSRHPSSRQSESYFIIMTTVTFHFFFYIIAPGTYYVLAQRIPSNIKLKQLFVAVLTFLAMTVIVAFIDLRYRMFNSRRKKIMSTWSQWGKLCQMKLHEEIRWPSFPIQFKLMVILNIWSFNAFYIFELPYLMFLFVVVITIVYWVDKKNIYKHYKMQVFQTIDTEISVQRDYIIMFLACVCCGYAACAVQNWQYYFVGGMFIVSLLANWFLSYRFKLSQKKIQKAMTLSEVVKANTNNPKQQIYQSIMSTQLRENLLVLDNASTVSLGSATFQYGYKQIYDNYLNQFKSKHIQHLLEQTFTQLENPNYNPEADVQKIRRTTYLNKMPKISQMSQLKSQKNDLHWDIVASFRSKQEERKNLNENSFNDNFKKQEEENKHE